MKWSFTCPRAGHAFRRSSIARVAVGASLVIALAAAAPPTRSPPTTSRRRSPSRSPTTEAGTEATGTPVKIGYANAGTGATALPEITEGAELAADRINEHENGINGHPDRARPVLDRRHARVLGGVREQPGGRERGRGHRRCRPRAPTRRCPILKDAGIATLGTSTLGTTQSLSQDAFFFSPAGDDLSRGRGRPGRQHRGQATDVAAARRAAGARPDRHRREAGRAQQHRR